MDLKKLICDIWHNSNLLPRELQSGECLEIFTYFHQWHTNYHSYENGSMTIFEDLGVADPKMTFSRSLTLTLTLKNAKNDTKMA